MEEQSKEAKFIFRPAARLLVVDDSPLNRTFIVNSFPAPGYEVIAAEDGERGLQMAKSENPELILLDIMMPNMDGFEVCRRLKADPETVGIPVIFITALDAIQDKLRAFEMGGVDFVTKPFNHKELNARVRTHVELRRTIGQKESMYQIAIQEKRGETIARIAAGVSHNFNNMLGVAFGNVMLAESGIDERLGGECPLEVRESLADVRESLERMQELVRKFLQIANMSSTKASAATALPADLRAVVEDVASNIRHQRHDAPNGYAVNIETKLEVGSGVLCQEAQITEALQLICNEAIETSGGKAEIVFSGVAADEVFRLEIAISNMPVSAELIESIFEPFGMPLMNVGTGLSFAVAKQLVELNRGAITAASPGNSRLNFTITLPRG